MTIQYYFNQQIWEIKKLTCIWSVFNFECANFVNIKFITGLFILYMNNFVWKVDRIEAVRFLKF